MSDDSLVRNLNGKAAVWLSGCGGEEVKILVSLDGAQRSMTREEWDRLGIWDGPDPLSYVLRR
jgi:hypothetical protein